MIAVNRSARSSRRGRLIVTAAAVAALGLGLTACQTGRLTVPDTSSPPARAAVPAPHGVNTQMSADRIEAMLDRRDAERADRYAEMWAAYEARLRDASPARELSGTADTLERLVKAEATEDAATGGDTVDRPIEAEKHMLVR